MKNKFRDIFQIWLFKIKNQSKCILKTLYANGKDKFISIKFRVFCKKKEITLKYVAPYIHKKNSLIEKKWQIIVKMKDSIFFNSHFSQNFWAEAMDIINYLRNGLSTKIQQKKLIPKKAWTKKQSDVSHFRVFESLANIKILKEKYYKFNIQKNWYGIFLEYNFNTIKYTNIWIPKKKELLIATNLYIDKSK